MIVSVNLKRVRKTDRHIHLSFHWWIAICLLACVCCVSCRPEGVLGKRQLINVLCDMHYADAVIQVAGMNYGHDEELAKAYAIVLEKHGVTQAQFDSTMVWYTNHPHRLMGVYPEVIAILDARNEEWLALHGTHHPHETEEPAAEPTKVTITFDMDWWRLPKAEYMSWEDAVEGVDSLRYYGVKIDMQDSVRTTIQQKNEEKCEEICTPQKKVVPLHAFSPLAYTHVCTHMRETQQNN